MSEQLQIQDQGEQTLKCSDCRLDLMHYRQYTKSDKIKKIKASCPFCGSFSFVKEIDGEFYFGPISQKESVSPTVVDETEEIDGIWVFKILKRHK